MHSEAEELRDHKAEGRVFSTIAERKSVRTGEN
jgi:hypothetical protein